MVAISDYLKLIRLKNSIMTSIAVLVGALAVTDQIAIPIVAYAALSAFLIAAASFCINNVCDQELDKSSGKPNPVSLRKISSDRAAGIAIIFSFLGVYLSLLSGSIITFILATISAGLAFAYSVYLKPKYANVGHLATSYSTGITYVYGWSVFGLTAFTAFSLVFLMFAITLTANFSRELIKVVADREGDLRWGIRTLAVVRDSKYAGKVAFVTMILAVFISAVPAFLGLYRSSYLVIVSFADFVLLLFGLTVYLRPTEQVANKMKNSVLWGMFIGLLAFIGATRFDYNSPGGFLLEGLSFGIFVLLLIKNSSTMKFSLSLHK